jgi:alpha-tubulin suppressor-like RCC1 family protein
MRREGSLYMWGKNKVGELGLEGMSVFAQVRVWYEVKKKKKKRV